MVKRMWLSEVYFFQVSQGFSFFCGHFLALLFILQRKCLVWLMWKYLSIHTNQCWTGQLTECPVLLKTLTLWFSLDTINVIKCQSLQDCTHWVLAVHTTFHDLNSISRSQQCQTVLNWKFYVPVKLKLCMMVNYFDCCFFNFRKYSREITDMLPDLQKKVEHCIFLRHCLNNEAKSVELCMIITFPGICWFMPGLMTLTLFQGYSCVGNVNHKLYFLDSYLLEFKYCTVATCIKKIMHNMLCVTGMYIRKIINIFCSHFTLKYESSEHIALLICTVFSVEEVASLQC